MVSSSFPRRTLFVAAVVAIVLLAWRLLDLLVLVFGAIVAATVLRALAEPIERRLRVPPSVGVALTVAALLVLFVGVGFVVGQPLAEQIGLLRERLPQALHQFVVWLGSHRLGVAVLQLWREASDGGIPWSRVASFAGLTLGALASVVLLVVAAIYLAAAPSTYRDGLLRLLPPAARPQADAALAAAGQGLRRWLKGQAVSMLFIGTTTMIGLGAIGAPLAIALGLVNGLLAFVPYIGAIVGGLLAILVAFVDGPRTALYVAILVTAIQQAEGYIVEPLVQRWAVRLAPVLSLVATVMFSVLFGLAGALLATPLMVVAMILVQKLYIEGYLERPAAQPRPLPPVREGAGR